MVNNCIICLGAGKAQIPLIKKAKELGFIVFGIDRNSASPGFELVDKKLIISTYESKLIINELENYIDKYNYVGVIARTSGPALYTAATISNHFNLTGLTAEIIPLATEKSTLRLLCKKHNIKFPKGIKIDIDGIRKIKLSVPIIVKPDLPLSGKKEVKLIMNDNDLEAAIQCAGKVSYNGLVEIEEFIEGFDIACLFRVNDNIASVITYWDEMVGIKKNGSIIGCGVSVPSVINKTLIKTKVENVVDKFSTVISSTIDALLILAFRIDANGEPHIIELHADLGGDLIADDLFPISDPNFDYFKSCIQIATKNLKNVAIPKFTPSAIIYKELVNEQLPSSRKTELLQSKDISGLHNKIRKKLIINKDQYLFMPNHFNIKSQFYN